MDDTVENPGRTDEIHDLLESKLIELLRDSPSASLIQAARQYLRDQVTSSRAANPQSQLELVREQVDARRMPFPTQGNTCSTSS